MKRLVLPLSLLLVTLLASACSRKDEPRKDDVTVKRAVTEAKPNEEPVGVLAPKEQLRSVAAPADGDVATQVKDAIGREAKEGRRLLVYIGATWCEPCKRFHAAAARGELDREFPNLTLLEYDADRDGERLVTANYNTHLIPYFGVPGTDGRGTGRHIEGGVKGSTSVEDIVPRLHELLGK